MPIMPPWTFKIEMTKGCNLACKFCPVSLNEEYRDPDQRQFLRPELAAKIGRDIQQLAPNARIELSMRGEPTLNPWFLDNVMAIRAAAPRAQISLFTNGITLLKNGPGLLISTLQSGVNIANIDCYGNTYDKFAAVAQSAGQMDGTIKIADFRDFSAYKRYPKGWLLKTINLVPDIADPARLVQVRGIHNMAGNIPPDVMVSRFGSAPQLPLAKTCARPWREMTVYHDGRVAICCHDWGEESIMGDANQKSLTEIWHGEAHLAVMRELHKRQRTFAPCNKCDYHGGYRLGLLQNPDKEVAV